MRLSLLAVSLIALTLSVPALAADIVIDESATTPGGQGGDGDAGDPGTAAAPAFMVDDYLMGAPGGDGDDGKPGDPGGQGTAGAHVALGTSGPTDGNIAISSNGSAGGAGGKGGRGGDGARGSDAFARDTPGISALAGNGGDGGDGGKGGVGGTGGAGGTITLTVDHAVAGSLQLSAVGGNGGAGGSGGAGGRGGFTGNASIGGPELISGGIAGDGGDGAIGGSGAIWGMILSAPESTVLPGVNGKSGASDPAAFRGADGEAGAGGTIAVAVNAAIGGGIDANAGTGTIRITLNDGASVRDPIKANEAATSALRFAMSIKDRAEYNAAKAYLGDAANALSGSLTINGQTYAWTGFDQLIDVLRFAGVTRYDPGTDRRAYLSCSPRAVTAFHQDGGIQLIASRTDERGAFRIGTLTGNSFVSRNDAGWTASLGAAKRGVVFDVFDARGEVVASCKG